MTVKPVHETCNNSRNWLTMATATATTFWLHTVTFVSIHNIINVLYAMNTPTVTYKLFIAYYLLLSYDITLR